MGTSVQPGATGAPPLREDVMLEDIEKDLKGQADKAKADKELADAKARAELEAKARADLLASQGPDPRVKALEEALRISEEGRKKQEEMFRSVGVQPKKEEAPAELTREELSELYSKDPLAAIEHLMAKATRALDENVSRRLEPLVAGGATSAKEMARSRYPDEFQLFSDDIEKMLADPRVNRNAMSNIQAWDDLISWVRGKPGNFEKLVEHRVGKDKEKAAKEAQERERLAAGSHTRSDVRAPASTGGEDLDPIEKEIARTIHPELSPEEAYSEHKKWRSVAR